MKTIGIIGAMEEEIEILKSKMEIVSAKKIIGTEFFLGKMNGKNIVLVRSGVGKVNAAICTQVLIDLYGADYIINTGVAGAVHRDLNIGDVVISSDLVQHDFDCTLINYAPGAIPGMGDSLFKADEELQRIAREAAASVLVNEHAYVGRIATGDCFVAEDGIKARIWDVHNAHCTEMEGAAIAHACYLNKIPFIVIRSISDKADHSAEVSFDTFVHTAAKISSDVVEMMINKM